MQADLQTLLPTMQRLFALKRSLGRRLAGTTPIASIGVLAALGRCGELRLSDLATALHVHPSVVTRQVAELENHGYVERRCDPGDGRSSFISLTDLGCTTTSDYFRRASDLIAKALESWSPDDVSTLTSLTERLGDDLEAAVLEPAG